MDPHRRLFPGVGRGVGQPSDPRRRRPGAHPGVPRALAIRHIDVRARAEHPPHRLQHVRPVGLGAVAGALPGTSPVSRRLPDVRSGRGSVVLPDGLPTW